MRSKLSLILLSLAVLMCSCSKKSKSRPKVSKVAPATNKKTVPAKSDLKKVAPAQKIKLVKQAENTLPNPKPFKESAGTARQNPVLQVKDFAYHKYGENKGSLHEQPSFVVGNKAVVVRKINGRNRPDQDMSVTIYIDNKQVGRFMWWGSFKDGGSGYPFKDIKGDPASLKINKKAKTVTFRKPYFTPAKKRAVFTYTITPLKDSKIKLSWNLGVSQKELEESSVPFGVSLWFSDNNYRGKKIKIGGKRFKEASRAELVSKKVSTPASGDFVYNAAKPLEGYKLELGDLRGNTIEGIYVPKVGNDRYEFQYRVGSKTPKAQEQIIIDLGEAALPQKNTPPKIGGIDFWKVDGIHVPLSATRNVMPNPSFENGLRFWTWVGGGATYRPDPLPRYDVITGGKFGKHAMILRNTQSGAPPIQSFPMSLEKGQVYTLSFYAKAKRNYEMKVALASAARGGKFKGKNGPWGDTHNPDAKFAITTSWKRYSRTFTADSAGLQIKIFGHNNTLIDGIQLEKGDKPTEFVCAPLDGKFTTADKDNSIVKGKPIDAGFTFTGKPGTTGEVSISAKNAFREIVYSGKFNIKIGQDGTQKISLPFDAKKFGEGIFVIRTDSKVKGFKPYTDYHRLFIMTPLSNTHATKSIFGTLGHYDRVTRGEDLAKKYMQWGFGSTSWGYSTGNEKLRPALEKKYRITNIATLVINEDRDIHNNYRKWKSVTPKMQQRIEKVAYKAAKARDPELYYTWAFGNEEEGSGLVRNKKFDEYFKAQYATAKGVKRAMPKAQIMPTCGTSGYSLMRGYDAMEGYLKAAQKRNFKYDAIAVHPYGNIDKGILSTNDLDEETARLIAQMKRYGYGKETPIYYTEFFNIPETYVPTWGADTAYDHYQAGKPSYDFGNREFIHAVSAARAYIILLKYWPHVQTSNIWTSRPFMDMNLTPLILCKAVNTLGTHLGDVKYAADIKPVAGVRGYAFKLKDGTGIAPIWCVNHDVENGLKRGAVLEVKFAQPVEFFDLMGNQRIAEPDKTGVTKVQLTPAPLLIKAKNVELLASALQNATSSDTSDAIKVSFNPDLKGDIKVQVKNQTGRVQSGDIKINGENLNYKVPYNVKPEKNSTVAILASKEPKQFGKLYKWENNIKIEPRKGDSIEKEWKMDYFYVPKTKGKPNWKKIPSIPISNRFVSTYTVTKDGAHGLAKPKAGYPGDLKANFKMAWDKDNLYLRVEVEDDKFLTFPQLWKNGNSHQLLYQHDGCLEIYFDTGADGRTNIAKTYDNDDYRYDFSLGKSGKSGKGMVYRLREVYHQLADGVNMASKKEASEKIKCDFRKTAKGYTYTITFGQRYLEPIVLRKGFVSGFGLFLHDRDDAKLPAGIKGLSLATEPGSHCDYKPQVWPLMILAE